LCLNTMDRRGLEKINSCVKMAKRIGIGLLEASKIILEVKIGENSMECR